MSTVRRGLAVGLMTVLPTFNAQNDVQAENNNEAQITQNEPAEFTPDFAATINEQRVAVDVELLDSETGTITAGFIASLNASNQDWRELSSEILGSTDPLIIHEQLKALERQHIDIAIPDNMPQNRQRRQLEAQIIRQVLADTREVYANTLAQWLQRNPEQAPANENVPENNQEQQGIAETPQDFNETIGGQEVRIYLSLLDPETGDLTYGFIASLDIHHGDAWKRIPLQRLRSTDPFDIHMALLHAEGHGDVTVLDSPDDNVISVQEIYERALREWKILNPSPTADADQTNDGQSRPQEP